MDRESPRGANATRRRRAGRLAGVACLCLLAVTVSREGAVRRVEAGDPPAAPPIVGDAPIPLDRFFHGAVVGLSGTRVKLRYDFSSEEQMKDWVEGVPWAIAKEPTDRAFVGEGRLQVRGNTGARHAGEWEGDLLVTCRLIPDGTQDIGGYLSSPDAPDDYATFTLVETYFHHWDGKAGGETGMMKFGKQFSAVAGGGFVGFRYLAFRMLPDPPVAGRALAFQFGRRGGDDVMVVGELDMKSNEPGNRMKILRPGFYAIKSALSVDDVLIEGTLASRFVADRKILLKTEKPIVALKDLPPTLDPAVEAILAGYRDGKETAARVVDVVKDPSRPDADRRAAADALKAGPRKSVTLVVDLLYSPDVGARTLGIDVVKGLIGKTYGYDPKAGEKARAAAIARLNKDLAEHPELREGQGG